VLYPSYTQIATLEGKNINRLTTCEAGSVSTGLAGKRHGSDGGCRLLKAAGLDADSGPSPAGAQRQRVG
jgi:hypothetical protein